MTDDHLVGKQALLPCANLAVKVTILEVRYIWGRDQILVTPVSGHGQRWVDIRSVRFK